MPVGIPPIWVKIRPQPWASLIATGQKQYETRGWSTNYRGLIAIHAGMNCHIEFCKIFDLNPAEIPKGAIVAIANLVDCIEMCPTFIGTQSESEIKAGDWQPGRFAWRLENVRAIAPIPLKGHQGLWNIFPKMWNNPKCNQ
jgi:hypothetical protein